MPILSVQTLDGVQFDGLTNTTGRVDFSTIPLDEPNTAPVMMHYAFTTNGVACDPNLAMIRLGVGEPTERIIMEDHAAPNVTSFWSSCRFPIIFETGTYWRLELTTTTMTLKGTFITYWAFGHYGGALA